MDLALVAIQKNFVDVWKHICFATKYYLFKKCTSGDEIKIIRVKYFSGENFQYWYNLK